MEKFRHKSASSIPLSKNKQTKKIITYFRIQLKLELNFYFEFYSELLLAFTMVLIDNIDLEVKIEFCFITANQ